VSSSPPVAIAVVSTNLRALLAACLRSMRPEAESGRAEVWVVDNASSDGSPQMVAERFPWVRLIASDTNLGYGRAINLVAERSDAPWIAAANEDIELRAGALERLLRTGEERPQAAVIAPQLELPDGSTQHSVHAFPTLAFTAFFNLGLHRLSPRLADRLCIEGYWDSSRPREVPWAIATFWLMRRKAFEGIGGFDSEMFIHSEDLDLGWRLSRAGWSSFYEPRATVFHVGSAASKKEFGEQVVQQRWLAASYSWMARRRSVAVERAVASVNVAGAGARWAWFGVLTPIAPRRFAPRRDRFKNWTRIHLTGLRPRRRLLGEHDSHR
jgi:N-acetylglucosaminyl-diphospho-decaprenol L-rhamnosyltransferase